MKAINKIGLFMISIAVATIGIAILNHEQVQTFEQSIVDDSGTNVAIAYKGHVDVYKTEALTGIKILVTSKDNLLVNNGKEYIKTQIGSGGAIASNSTKYISLSNDATAPAAGDTIIPTEINANGLSRATATYASNGTGAWNYTYEWTATASQSVQLTGLNYDSIPASDGNLFASLQFAAQSLLVNDKLQVIWSISVS